MSNELGHGGGATHAARDDDLRRAEREIAAHLAVSEALSVWDSLERGGERLLRELAAALDFAVGVLWLPRCDVLEPGLFCTVPSCETLEYERATRELRLPIGVDLPGLAWTRREPVAFESLTADPRFVRREAAARDGLSFALAIPALVGGEVLAVVELCSKHTAELTGRLMRLLIGVGYELGGFLARRRAELKPPPLTARQLEILRLASRGLSTLAIAEDLAISRATAKSHFEHIYERLAVSDRAAAVAHALREGLIE
jgi:DNA-binding CsgD family transcriptional regulator